MILHVPSTFKVIARRPIALSKHPYLLAIEAAQNYLRGTGIQIRHPRGVILVDDFMVGVGA
jgi:hypothetical protein